MRIINADGSEAEMCGNGARCMAAYAFKTRFSRKKIISMETLAGIIQAQKTTGAITVELSNPKDYTENITLKINKRNLQVNYIDTGVPHVICFVEGLENIDVDSIGREIRLDEKFSPRGTNVNFVEQKTKNLVQVRTYERGVEAETRACGTGSVAAAIISFIKANPKIETRQNAKMSVKTSNGETLKISFNLSGDVIDNVKLSGSANFIAKGFYYFWKKS